MSELECRIFCPTCQVVVGEVTRKKVGENHYTHVFQKTGGCKDADHRRCPEKDVNFERAE